MEIPSPLTGTLTEILVQNGDKINQGDDLCIIEITEPEVPNKEEVESIEPDIKEEPKSTFRFLLNIWLYALHFFFIWHFRLCDLDYTKIIALIDFVSILNKDFSQCPCKWTGNFHRCLFSF